MHGPFRMAICAARIHVVISSIFVLTHCMLFRVSVGVSSILDFSTIVEIKAMISSIKQQFVWFLALL